MSPSQSARLPPPPPPVQSVQSVQSVSELRRRYLMVFIYTFHVGFLMPCPPPPLDVVLSTPRAFSLWAILGGFMVGPDLPLIPFRSILKQETETGRLRPPPHSSPPPRYPTPAPLFIFISDCMCSDGSLAWKRKKSRKMKVNMCVCGRGRSEHHLTGGAQLANHRGSCDAAGVASATFQQNGKLALRRPLVPLNRRSAATWVNVQPVVLLLLHQTP